MSYELALMSYEHAIVVRIGGCAANLAPLQAIPGKEHAKVATSMSFGSDWPVGGPQNNENAE